MQYLAAVTINELQINVTTKGKSIYWQICGSYLAQESNRLQSHWSAGAICAHGVDKVCFGAGKPETSSSTLPSSPKGRKQHCS